MARASRSSTTKMPKQVVNTIETSLQVARDHGLDIPAGLQAVATNLITLDKKSGEANDGKKKN